MDMYVKQLITEIKAKEAQMEKRYQQLASFSKKILSKVIGHASEYERYYQLIKTADDDKVSPGSLPFSVYSRPTPVSKSKDDGDESEKISNVLDDQKKVFNRTLHALKSEAISVEQSTGEYIEMIKDLLNYYEDLIEGLKF